MTEVVVIGGGPAGMLAAIFSARAGHRTVLLEKNEKLGKKLYITGKGRCNVTNETDTESLIGQTVSNPKFMYSAYYTFDSWQAISFFESIGLPLKVERGHRVFPASDKSSDVIAALYSELKRQSVDVRLGCQVNGIKKTDGSFIVDTSKGEVAGTYVVLATGGLSYPSTGSTGEGYDFAKSFGHTVVQPVPALVPLNVDLPWVQGLQGLSLKNVRFTLFEGGKAVYSDIGEMLFTHFGITGPLVLSASSFIKGSKGLRGEIDLKPGLDKDKLDKRLLRDFEKNANKHFKNSLDALLPNRLIDAVITLSGIDSEKLVHQITKEERLKIVDLLKHLTFSISGKRSFKEAVITRGGINTKEINPNTMESKLVDNLYFAGEVIDVDALTGGFNLQVAYSTAVLAAISIDEKGLK